MFPDSLSNTSKIIISTFLFCYFGFIIIPEWSHPFSVFLLWLSLLPVVLIILVANGIHGGIRLWRAKSQNLSQNPEHKFSYWLAIIGVMWFLISILLAQAAHFAYNHQKFDTEKWKSSNWEDGDMLELSPKERMLDDLTQNILPGRTKSEIIKLLGQPDEIEDVEGKETLFYYTSWNIMEPQCLSMMFDEQGIIKEYHMTTCE